MTIDLFELADASGRKVLFLDICDMASSFQVVSAVYGRHPKAVFQRFCETWCAWAGPPFKMRLDMDGEVPDSFATGMKNIGTYFVTTSALSPTQNAYVERHGGQWKHIAQAVTRVQGVSFS